MSQVSDAAVRHHANHYSLFERKIADRLNDLDGPVFRTEADPDLLWQLYLDNIPFDVRQTYNCHCCRRFVQKFGGLVQIDDDGRQRSVLWRAGEAPGLFAAGVATMQRYVEMSIVAGVFLTRERVWGTPTTGEWTHLHGTPRFAPFFHKLKSAHQAMAEKTEEIKTLSLALDEYTVRHAELAVSVLEHPETYRAEKGLGVAKWLLDLKKRVEAIPANLEPQRRNLVWLLVATAPVGFAHVRSGVISTLLDDIKEGKPFEKVVDNWGRKLDPVKYRRPTAAPTAGAIDQAEKIFATLGLAPALERRFASLEDVKTFIWRPTDRWTPPVQRREERRQVASAVFAHLRPPPAPPTATVNAPRTNVTWAKFSKTVLLGARKIELKVPAHANFFGMLTAVHPDAPAIIQWDGLEGFPRNPASVYVWQFGSSAVDWCLTPNKWTPITGIFSRPGKWQDPEKFEHDADCVMFAIEGCQERRPDRVQLCLFPEILKSELHPVRSVIEAHNRSRHPIVQGPMTANGISVASGTNLEVRVHTDAGISEWCIDRLD